MTPCHVVSFAIQMFGNWNVTLCCVICSDVCECICVYCVLLRWLGIVATQVAQIHPPRIIVGFVANYLCVTIVSGITHDCFPVIITFACLYSLSCLPLALSLWWTDSMMRPVFLVVLEPRSSIPVTLTSLVWTWSVAVSFFLHCDHHDHSNKSETVMIQWNEHPFFTTETTFTCLTSTVACLHDFDPKHAVDTSQSSSHSVLSCAVGSVTACICPHPQRFVTLCALEYSFVAHLHWQYEYWEHQNPQHT